MKDNFSKQSGFYKKFRPSYPKKMYDYLYSFINDFDYALDCATGNGQVASELALKFKKIVGTDISRNQLSHAHQSEKIHYIVENAEQMSVKNNTINLLTVAQAVHWFNFKQFYSETERVLKPGGIIAIIGYHLLRINDQVDGMIDKFYSEVVGSYWDEERKFIDEYYRTIPFPFKEVETPEFHSEFEWDLNHLTGYLNSWSAVQHFITRNNYNPLSDILKELYASWGEVKLRKVKFPVFMRLGIKE